MKVAAGAAGVARVFGLLGSTTIGYDREREVEHFSTRVVLGRRPPIEGVEPDPQREGSE